MQSIMKLASMAVVASLLAQSNASAHAFLDRAVPSVGGTVSGSPREIRLFFTQGVVPAFSGVRIASETGTTISTGKVAVDPSDPTIVIVRLGRTLPPGSYTVSWHVVSVDTHPTQGTFRFTVI
jgi:methionine-rich copper-binding protein CopC